MIVLRIVIDIFFITGVFFILSGVIGIIRMPDTFCRLQSSTNIATMGAIPIALACSIYGFITGNTSVLVKSLVIIFFIIITSPVASNSMAKAIYKQNEKLFKKKESNNITRSGSIE